VHHKKWGAGSWESILDYNHLMYFLSGICPHPTRTQIGSIEAYQGVWQPGLTTQDSARKTYTVESGIAGSGNVEKYAFTQLKNLSLDMGQDDFTVKSDAISRYPVLGATITASPTSIAPRPVERNDINLYIDDLFANL